MEQQWTQERLEQYIDDGVEENLTLEYKSSDGLQNNPKKKQEITKDVSAMANSAGGIVVYRVKEHDEKEKRHLPERLDGINRIQFSREWLENIINNIQPRIVDLIIHSVTIGTGTDQIIYVVEIPQSTTAHQAQDFRYYRRFNFQSVPMNDYEIRDVMNRATSPNADVAFGYKTLSQTGKLHKYRLVVKVGNLGIQVIHSFKLQFTFPNYGDYVRYRDISSYANPYFGLIEYSKNDYGELVVAFRSKDRLFPQDEVDIGKHINLQYEIDDAAYWQLKRMNGEQTASLSWILFADDSPPKRGELPFSDLNEF